MKPPIQSRTDLATWIDSCVLGDLRTLLLGVDTYYASSSHLSIEGRPLGSANFLLVAGCCSALDYFAFLFKGRGPNEANVRAFIERFLQPIDSRYSEVGLILWRCFRHGTVHRSWPKRILIEGDASSSVTTGAGNETTDPHLASSPDFGGDTFLINGRQLLSDLTLAFDRGFRNWILSESPDSVMERANPEDLFVSAGDTEGRRQLEAIKRWNHEVRATHS
jgi:hypothetical protein